MTDSVSTPVQKLNQSLRQPNLSILGNAIKSLPPAQWKERMFFAGAADTDLRKHTRSRFPATLRQDKDTHPVFVFFKGQVSADDIINRQPPP